MAKGAEFVVALEANRGVVGDSPGRLQVDVGGRGIVVTFEGGIDIQVAAQRPVAVPPSQNALELTVPGLWRIGYSCAAHLQVQAPERASRRIMGRDVLQAQLGTIDHGIARRRQAGQQIGAGFQRISQPEVELRCQAIDMVGGPFAGVVRCLPTDQDVVVVQVDADVSRVFLVIEIDLDLLRRGVGYGAER